MRAKRVLSIVIVTLLLSGLTSVALAAPASAPRLQDNGVAPILALLFPAEFIKAIVGMVVLIVLDLLLGVSVAIKQKQFNLAHLADFYGKKVLPNLLGWASIDILLRVAAYYQLPIVEQLQPIGSAALYAVVLAALFGQVAAKITQLRDEVPATS